MKFHNKVLQAWNKVFFRIMRAAHSLITTITTRYNPDIPVAIHFKGNFLLIDLHNINRTRWKKLILIPPILFLQFHFSIDYIYKRTYDRDHLTRFFQPPRCRSSSVLAAFPRQVECTRVHLRYKRLVSRYIRQIASFSFSPRNLQVFNWKKNQKKPTPFIDDYKSSNPKEDRI